MRMTDYYEQQLRMHEFRGGTYAKPTAQYIGLFRANRGKWVAATAYVVGDYVIPNTPNGRLYRCTTGGTSGGAEPTWGTVDGGTTADGTTVVWTEQSIALDAGTIPEVVGAGYARQNLAPGDLNWTAPDGTGGLTDNAAAITYAAPGADWGLVVGFFVADALAAGNAKIWGMVAAPKNINNGDPAPSFPIGSLDIVFG